MSTLWPILYQFITHPKRIFVHDDQRKWRGIELLVGSFHMADTIEKTTSKKRIGIMLPTSGMFPIATFGTWMLGRTIVPINYLLQPEDMQHVCDDSDIDTVITVKPMLDFLPKPPTGVKYLLLEDINFKQFPALRWPHIDKQDELAVILYTSGTSGKPKGVMLSHGNISSNIKQCIQWADFTAKDSIVGVLPQFHSFGLTILTLVPLTVGMPVYFLAKFEPRKVIQLLRRHQPTAMIAIPSMYNALLSVKKAKPEDWSHMRFLVSGGEPLPNVVADGFRERFKITINEGFGLTETSPVSHWCRPHEFKPHTVGKSLPGVKTRIVDTNENDLQPGEEGEIRLAGPNIMQGYLNLPDETAAVFDDQGYFKTGDMGKVDDEGFLYITGRIKEMLIIGGENVFPREIEEVLNRHPAVYESAVIGQADPARGEVPIAFVEIAEGKTFDQKDIRVHCRETLPQYKVPRAIYRMDALPRNPTGKILRRMLVIPDQTD